MLPLGSRQRLSSACQLSPSHRQLSLVHLSLAIFAFILSCVDTVSACDPTNNCNEEGFCCCSNSIFYAARPVGRSCHREFRGSILAAVLVPILVGLALCIVISYCLIPRWRGERPHQGIGPEAGMVPTSYIAGPGAYPTTPTGSGNFPGSYVAGPGAYPGTPGVYSHRSGDFSGALQSGPGVYPNNSGAYVGGPGAYVGGPGTYQGGLLPAYSQPAYGTPVAAYPPAATLPGDQSKGRAAPYRV